MVGSNETYRASLDEGFTQFLTAWSLVKIDGDTLLKTSPRSKYVNKHLRKELAIDSRVYYPYIADAARQDETTLNTHSDDFNGALAHGGGYRNVYFKTATMLYNLQYVLGDSVFLGGMQHYFNKWKMCHPYVEDFRDAFTEYTQSDLTWFFDQWFDTPKTIDYKVKSIKKGKEKDTHVITLQRNGAMQMPIDLTVTDDNGTATKYYIPNTWYVKKTDATLLPKWYGWGKINPEYSFTITNPNGIKSVQIDPTNRLADNYVLDNSKGIKKTEHFLDAQVPNTPNWRKRQVYWRPEVWGNAYDFLKVGFHTNGSYMNYRKVFDFTFWVSTWTKDGNRLLTDNNGYNYAGRSNWDRFNFRFNFKDALDRINKGMGYNVSARLLDGAFIGQFGLDQWNKKQTIRYYTYFKVMARYDDNYLFNPLLWSGYGPNNTLNVGFDHKYNYIGGKGDVNVNLRASALSEFNYSQLSGTHINQHTKGKFEFKTRLFAMLGIGQNVPLESALYIAGANPEQMMDNKFTRARGFYPAEWAAYGNTTNNLHHAGGMNLRGYAGYLLPNEMVSDLNPTTYNNYFTRSGIATNIEIEFDRLVKFKPKKLSDYLKLNTYAFVDAGYVINHLGIYESFSASFPKLKNKFLADAGFGVALTVKRWGNLYQAKPFTLRFDMPLWLSEKPVLDNSNFKFRWVLGVSRAF